MKKYFLFLILVSPAVAWALGSWTFYPGQWYNSTTGQTLNLGVGTYPPGINTFTPTLTFTPTTTYYGTKTPSPSATPTPTGTYLTATNTPFTFVPPTATQTPVQGTVTPVAAVFVGASWTAGYDATPVASNFASWTTAALNVWYPTTQQINFGYIGASAGDYLNLELASNIANTPGYGFGLPKFLVFGSDLAINCLRYPYSSSYSGNTGPDCTFGASVSACEVYSQTFKTYTEAIMNGWMSAYPSGIPVVMTIPDISNAGAGPYTFFGGWTSGGYSTYFQCVQIYNQRMREIASLYNCRLVDVYSILYNHPEYYDGGLADPLHLNSWGQQAIGNEIIRQLSSPPQPQWR